MIGNIEVNRSCSEIAFELAEKIDREYCLRSRYAEPLLYTGVMWRAKHYNLTDEDNEELVAALHICKIARFMVERQDIIEAIAFASAEWSRLEGKSYKIIESINNDLIREFIADKNKRENEMFRMFIILKGKRLRKVASKL